MTSIRVDALSKSYGAIDVLKSIAIDVGDGAFFTLLGPSGCGKTTLLRVLAGFVEPSGGAVYFGAEDVTQKPTHKRNVGMVFQDYALFPDKTVFENVAYGLRARRVSAADLSARVTEHLEKVNIAHLAERYPAALSGGQRQRVALARALVIEPQVLLMDEPLSNLDAKLRIQMREVIRDLQQRANITTVFVTHDQEEALALSDWVAVMRGGRVEQLGSPYEIYSNPKTDYIAEFVGAANLLPAKHIEGQPGGVVVCDVLGQTIRGQCSVELLPQSLKLVARPEETAIHEANQNIEHCGSVNCLPGQVTAYQYLGHKSAYTVVLADGCHITVTVPGMERGDAIPEGTKVCLDLGPNPRFVSAE